MQIIKTKIKINYFYFYIFDFYSNLLHNRHSCNIKERICEKKQKYSLQTIILIPGKHFN